MYNTQWQFIVPDEATNLVLNPSLEVDTTGWTASPGSTAIRASGVSYFGACSLLVTPDGPANGAYYTNDSSFLLTSGHTYHITFWMLATADLPYAAAVTTDVGPIGLQEFPFTSASGWQRYDFNYTEVTGSAQRRIYILTDDDAITGTEPFYIDGLMLIADQDYESTYIDGDQSGCFWNGEEHLSTSTRDGQYRKAGKIVEFDDYGLGVQNQTGIGMVPVQNIVQEYGLADGALYRGTKIRPRVFQLVSTIQPNSADGLKQLHVLRDAIIDVIKPNIVGHQQEMQLRYTGAGTVRTINALYEEGMSFETDTPYLEVLPLRFLATDPYFYEEQQQSAFMSARETISGSYFAQVDRFGEWTALGTFDSNAHATVFDAKRGYYFLGGQFANPQPYLAKYDPVTGNFSTIGGGTPNSTVTCLALDDTTGDLYIGGAFTSVAGVANTRGIAKWTRATNSWGAVGMGTIDGVVSSIAIGNDRTVYFGGTFTAASGVANTSRIARYNQTTAVVSAMGTGVNGAVNDIIIGPDSSPYVTGDFTTSNSVTTRGLARWTGSTFAAVGSLTTNMDGRVMVFGLDGALYWSFNSTTLNGVAGYNYIAKWNGTQWSALGTGLASSLYAKAMSIDKQGNLVVGGLFFVAGGSTLPGPFAMWNGSSWYPFGYRMPFVGGSVNGLYINPGNGTMTLAFATAAGIDTEYTATITNRGKADAFPTITITNSSATDSATLYFIKNYTTGDTIYFNSGLVLNPNEVFTLQLKPNAKKFTSNFQGNIISKILPGSNLREFRLLSGANRMSFFSNGGANVIAKFLWTPAHMSADGGAIND